MFKYQFETKEEINSCSNCLAYRFFESNHHIVRMCWLSGEVCSSLYKEPSQTIAEEAHKKLKEKCPLKLLKERFN